MPARPDKPQPDDQINCRIVAVSRVTLDVLCPRKRPKWQKLPMFASAQAGWHMNAEREGRYYETVTCLCVVRIILRDSWEASIKEMSKAAVLLEARRLWSLVNNEGRKELRVGCDRESYPLPCNQGRGQGEGPKVEKRDRPLSTFDPSPPPSPLRTGEREKAQSRPVVYPTFRLPRYASSSFRCVSNVFRNSSSPCCSFSSCVSWSFSLVKSRL